MNKRFYQINQERAGFQRLQLTKVGHLDPCVETIHTFTNGDGRYLRIGFNCEPSSQFLEILDKRIKSFGKLTLCFNSDDLEKLFESCLPRQAPKKYLLYFDRPTYTRQES